MYIGKEGEVEGAETTHMNWLSSPTYSEHLLEGFYLVIVTYFFYSSGIVYEIFAMKYLENQATKISGNVKFFKVFPTLPYYLQTFMYMVLSV